MLRYVVLVTPRKYPDILWKGKVIPQPSAPPYFWPGGGVAHFADQDRAEELARLCRITGKDQGTEFRVVPARFHSLAVGSE